MFYFFGDTKNLSQFIKYVFDINNYVFDSNKYLFESNKKLIKYNVGIKHLFNSIKYVSDINNNLFDSNKYLFQSNKKFRSEIKFLRNICLDLVIHFFLTWNVRIEDLFNKFLLAC